MQDISELLAVHNLYTWRLILLPLNPHLAAALGAAAGTGGAGGAAAVELPSHLRNNDCHNVSTGSTCIMRTVSVQYEHSISTV
jgi:hypothetical protein